MKSGGQPGNKNASKGVRGRDALITALVLAGLAEDVRNRRMKKMKPGDRSLVQVELGQVRKGWDGDTQAANHIMDRLDGKPKQALDIEQKTVSTVNFTNQDASLA